MTKPTERRPRAALLPDGTVEFIWLDKRTQAIQHIDGNRRNNDPSNLRIVTLKQNRRDR